MSEIASPKARKRCAVYCRVSTDERLDQEFNSIDAQREAGHAYIASQRTEGWISVADDYDDPGFSGGNTERPALKRLMADIERGKIDIVVVYKIDRLTPGSGRLGRQRRTAHCCGHSDWRTTGSGCWTRSGPPRWPALPQPRAWT